MAVKLKTIQPKDLEGVVDEELLKHIYDSSEPLLEVEGKSENESIDTLVEIEVALRKGIRLGVLE